MDSRVNARQLGVLNWIAEGCPPGRWPPDDFTYKTTSIALANRGLVALKGRGPNWTAAITDAGRHFLVHSNYPEGHRFARAPLPAVTSTAREADLAPKGRRERQRPTPSRPAIDSPNHIRDQCGSLPDGDRPGHPWDDKVLVSVKEAAWLLSVSEGLIRSAAVNGDLDRVFIGTGTTNYRIVHTSLLAWVDAMPREPVRYRW